MNNCRSHSLREARERGEVTRVPGIPLGGVGEDLEDGFQVNIRPIETILSS